MPASSAHLAANFAPQPLCAKHALQDIPPMLMGSVNYVILIAPVPVLLELAANVTIYTLYQPMG